MREKWNQAVTSIQSVSGVGGPREVFLVEKQAHIPHVHCVQSQQPAFLLFVALEDRIGNFGGSLLVVKPVPESGKDSCQPTVIWQYFMGNVQQQAAPG